MDAVGAVMTSSSISMSPQLCQEDPTGKVGQRAAGENIGLRSGGTVRDYYNDQAKKVKGESELPTLGFELPIKSH